ncbi:monofunctional biosynthetic peptidoglycan transglycosylase [Litorimonas sp. RW-G-Af-16]|uniref:monofunctional biosynthetic peptidoglycan transglycosylase n=1 Tax=Litorimonas sp. RW-G-Af-16 TaxID=3241168 RepID=UPI003AAA3758
MTNTDETGAKKPVKRRWLWRAMKTLIFIGMAVHLNAVALRFINPPQTFLMMQRGWAGEDVRREWVNLEDMSPYIIEAVMAGEDGRFCEHRGIDWAAIETAIEDNQSGGRKRGGSTITQQTAKNVFLWNGGGYIRKAVEAWFATLIDVTWGKSRVMEVYLNVAEWGDGIFGIEQAAQIRFGKPAKDLTRREAALLAAVLPSPNKWRIDPPSEFVSGRASTLQSRMTVIRNSGYANCVTGVSAVPTRTHPPAKVSPLLTQSPKILRQMTRKMIRKKTK